MIPLSKDESYRIPNAFINWPWKRKLSPYYLEVKAESSTWIESLKPFETKAQAAFNKCNFNLLACLTYATRHKGLVRVACDLMNFYFVYDEYTDVMDANESMAVANVVMDILRRPMAEDHAGSLIGDITPGFWKGALALVEPGDPCIEHFISGFEEYTTAVAQEADDRSKNHLRSVNDYLTLRRKTSSSKAIFSLIEFGLELPEFVLSHSLVSELHDIAADLCAVTNDLHSYPMEQARGLDGHNIITCIMHEHGLELQGALDWLGAFMDSKVTRFLSIMKDLPSWDTENDKKMKVYIDGLGHWVRGNECWSLESERYYGRQGSTVDKLRVMQLHSRQECGLVSGQAGAFRDVEISEKQ